MKDATAIMMEKEVKQENSVFWCKGSERYHLKKDYQECCDASESENIKSFSELNSKPIKCARFGLSN